MPELPEVMVIQVGAESIDTDHAHPLWVATVIVPMPPLLGRISLTTGSMEYVHPLSANIA